MTQRPSSTALAGPHSAPASPVVDVALFVIWGNGRHAGDRILADLGNRFELLELYEVSKPRGRSIPFQVIWGDYGYLECCCVCTDVLSLARNYLNEGLELISHPTPIDLQEEGLKGTAWFIYVRDPDDDFTLRDTFIVRGGIGY